ncbi:MAG: ABC transporter substrate-binding protein [Rhizobiaceae bacterium]|nr:ABC transporter substrate-binding protein [Rhizobiaceae bacterium]
MKFRERFIAAALGLAALPLSYAPGYAEDLTVGALFPLSGPVAAQGEDFASGSDLAVEHINADKILSGKLSIRYEDSQAMPQVGVVGMTKLVNVDQVKYVLTAYTGVSKAIAPLCQRNEVVCANAGGLSPDLAKLGEYFWNVIPLVDQETKSLTSYLVNKRDLKKIALIYIDDPSGVAIRDLLTTQLKEVGGELVASYSLPPEAQQFSGIAAQVRSLNPDAIYLATYGDQQLQVIKQLRDNGVDKQLLTYSGNSWPAALQLPEAQGMIITSEKVDYTSDDPVTKRFVEDYRKKYSRDPTLVSTNYYNAIMLYAALASALEKEGLEVNGANLLKKRLEIGTFKLAGVTVTFQENGGVTVPIRINVVKDQALSPIADSGAD